MKESWWETMQKEGSIDKGNDEVALLKMLLKKI